MRHHDWKTDLLILLRTPLALFGGTYKGASRRLAAPKRYRASRAPLPSAVVAAVLFTCAGQRVDIVTAFREAGATTIATDVDQLAPALYHADQHAIVPRVDDPATSPRSATSSSCTTCG